MRHLKKISKLGRTASHRKAMLANMASSLLGSQGGRIITTVPKAKALRSVVERLITHAKKGSLAARRHTARTIRDKAVLARLFGTIAPLYKEREGGYTRILKLRDRKGDGAGLAIVELVNLRGEEQPRRTRKKSSASKPGAVETGGKKPGKPQSTGAATSPALPETAPGVEPLSPPAAGDGDGSTEKK
jgi:large subunit ribosomal protein L17